MTDPRTSFRIARLMGKIAQPHNALQYERRRLVLDHVIEHGFITTARVQEMFNHKNSHDAHRFLVNLIEEGVLERIEIGMYAFDPTFEERG